VNTFKVNCLNAITSIWLFMMKLSNLRILKTLIILISTESIILANIRLMCRKRNLGSTFIIRMLSVSSCLKLVWSRILWVIVIHTSMISLAFSQILKYLMLMIILHRVLKKNLNARIYILKSLSINQLIALQKIIWKTTKKAWLRRRSCLSYSWS